MSTRYVTLGGERGIRTPGASQHDGFQDRCNRPLYHLSLVNRHKKYSCFVFDGAKVRIIYGLCKFSWYFFEIKSLFDERAISKEYDTMIYDVLLIIYWDFQT